MRSPLRLFSIDSLPFGFLFIMGWAILITLIIPTWMLLDWGADFITDEQRQSDFAFNASFYLLISFGLLGIGLNVLDALRI